MAFGVVVSGMEVGLMTGAPVAEILIDVLQSWRRTFFVIALLASSNLLFCPLMSLTKLHDYHPPVHSTVNVSSDFIGGSSEASECETTRLISGENTSSPQQLGNKLRGLANTFCSIEFVCIGFCGAGLDIAYGCSYTFLPLLTDSLGLSANQSAWLLTVFGASGILFRLIFLLFGEVRFTISSVLTCFFLFLMGLSSVFVPFCKTFHVLLIYCVVMGMCLGKYFITHFTWSYTV